MKIKLAFALIVLLFINSCSKEKSSINGLPPIADFTADKINIEVGESIEFSNQSTNDPTFWNWEFGDGATSNIPNPLHVYNLSGTYTVTLSVENAFGTDKQIQSGLIIVKSKTGTISDLEGNVYKTVKIGEQWWMSENIKSTKYANGTPIANIKDKSEWIHLNSNNVDKGYCLYNNNESSIYGGLYSFAAAVNGTPQTGNQNIQGVCPTDWHVPSDAEWNELENYLISNGYNFDGTTSENKIGKALASTSGWENWEITGRVGYRQSSNNASGFNALPGGYRQEVFGVFNGAEANGHWWSSDEKGDIKAYTRNLGQSEYQLLRQDWDKSSGLSVRCLRDN